MSSYIANKHYRSSHKPSVLWRTQTALTAHHFMQQHIAIFSELDVSSSRHKPVRGAEMNPCDFFHGDQRDPHETQVLWRWGHRVGSLLPGAIRNGAVPTPPR